MTQWLRTGAPYLAVVLVLGAAFAGLLAVAAIREDESLRGYAHLRATEGGCELHADRSRNALRCVRLRRGVYRVIFSRSLRSSAVVATRETCCPGEIAASIDSDRSVLIALPRGPYPVLAYILVG